MARTGRPATAMARFDVKVFEALLAVKSTREECELVLGMSRASLDRAIRRQYGPKATFEQVALEKAVLTKISLRRRVLNGAMSGDRTLLIFASKTMAGLSERVTVEEDEQQRKAREAAADQRARATATAMGQAVGAAVTDALQLEEDRVQRLMALLATGAVTAVAR